MKVTTERLDNCQVNVIIELDAAETEEKLRQTARKLSREFTVPGYRRGRAPFHAVIRVFGREAVQQQTLEEYGNDIYEQALEEIEYEPYAIGDLQEVEWDPFRMVVQIPIPPEADLGDYRAVRVPFEPEEVSDEDVEAELERMRQEFAQWVPVERPAQMGDQVLMDYHGAAGDEPVMDNENYELLLEEGALHPLPGFHEQVVGMAPAETKTFELQVPEDDEDEEVAGKTATITATVHAVHERDLPEMDDELAMMVGTYETLDELRASVRDRLESEALEREEADYLSKVLEAMVEAAPRIEYPSQAVDREADMALNQLEQNFAMQGLPPSTLWSMMGKTREQYKQEMGPVAEDRLRRRLVLEEVGRREGLEPDDDEIEAEIERMVAMAGEEAEEMREMLESPEGRASITEDLRIDLARERVKAIGRGEAPDLPEVEEEEEEEAAAETEAEAEAEAEPEAEAETEAEAEPETGRKRAYRSEPGSGVIYRLETMFPEEGYYEQ
ncbi:MAG: trigger factor [Anaerolineae bacterium]